MSGFDRTEAHSGQRNNDLIDQHHVLTFPVVLGTGKRLFPEGCRRSAFALAETQTTGTGIVISTYRRAGDVPTGSFALEDEAAEPA